MNKDSTDMSSLLSREEIEICLGKFTCTFSSDIIFRSQTFLKKKGYIIEILVGVGTFGVVWKGKNIENNEEVAIKLISINDKVDIEKEFKETQLTKMVKS